VSRSLWGRLVPRRPRRHQAFFERVLGTSLEIQVLADRRRAAEHAETRILGEIQRLEQVFSVFLPDSELSTWCRTLDRPFRISEELAVALEETERWRVWTEGAFDPRAELHTRHWQARERDSNMSSALSHSEPFDADAPLWIIERGGGEVTARKLTPHPISLNALAKGIIIDRSCGAAARVDGVRQALVNVGGDLRHIGDGHIRVGIANPFVDAENAPPLATVCIRGQGLATSGSYRRGFRIGDRHRSHIIDPRNGHPAEEVLSATVIAPSAADADALATAFSVLHPPRSLELADSLPAVACLLVTADRRVHTSSRWESDASRAPEDQHWKEP
jgi:FAD:protein FMN transferase